MALAFHFNQCTSQQWADSAVSQCRIHPIMLQCFFHLCVCFYNNSDVWCFFLNITVDMLIKGNYRLLNTFRILIYKMWRWTHSNGYIHIYIYTQIYWFIYLFIFEHEAKWRELAATCFVICCWGNTDFLISLVSGVMKLSNFKAALSIFILQRIKWICCETLSPVVMNPTDNHHPTQLQFSTEHSRPFKLVVNVFSLFHCYQLPDEIS